MNIRTTIEFEDVDNLLEKLAQAGLMLAHDLLKAKLGQESQKEEATKGNGVIFSPEDAASTFGGAGAAG
jgi:hypothetical protein